MFLTEQEILDTPQALRRTYSYFTEQTAPLKGFFAEHTQRKLIFCGCGSSYMLAKSAAAIFSSMPGTAAFAIPAGDYTVNPDFWQETIRDSIIVSLSRSGRTTEMVRTIRSIKEMQGCPVISISMEKDNDIMPMSDLDLTMDWCYDRSVCQTRTVANLYAAVLLLACAYTEDATLLKSVEKVCLQSDAFQQQNRSVLEQLAVLPWRNVVVLADGPVCGIAEEAALAFTEIAMLPGSYFHLLDYRHGPVVISSDKTLTLMLLQTGEDKLQGSLVKELVARGGPVVTVSEQTGNPYGAMTHICLGEVSHFAVTGIAFIYLAQMLGLLKAIEMGGNPDAPTGLNAYITL